jgi:Putative peptidoglycan binding domain.
VSSKDEGVKKASAWDWFDFSRLTENASLVEFYKDVELSEKRNKDNPSLDKYQLTLKTTLSILDRQYPTDSPENKKYAYIKDNCFKGIKEKPILFEALGRLLVNYKSEWYSEINTEGKMPDWEALNSVMTEDAENVLGYLRDGDEAKRDAHLKNIGKTADSEEAAGLQERRDKISQFPADYKQNPKEKLNPAQLEQYYYMQDLETKVAKWEKEKEKIKQCLWWDDVVKGLANQNQSTTDSGAISENESTPSTPTEQTEPEAPPPATLNPNGKAWFIHPISMMNYFSAKTYLFEKGDKHEIIREINIRLAGFGGNVPTDEFTDRTEKMIKQFQRDYMEVEETGVVDMDVIKAIDDFSYKYDLPSDEWVKKSSAIDETNVLSLWSV